MNKTNYARVGEFVELVEPKIFVRVGYPLCVRDIMNIYGAELEDKFYNLRLENVSRRVHGMMIAGLATLKLEQLDFGGNERKIYTEEIDKSVLGIHLVVAKKMIKTGIRYSPQSYYSSYSSEYDYESGGLAEEETHCVYTIKTSSLIKYKVLASSTRRLNV